MPSVATRTPPTYHRSYSGTSSLEAAEAAKKNREARERYYALQKTLISTRKKRVRLLQVEVKGVSCCDNKFQCEWLVRNRTRHLYNCKWYGDTLETKHEVGVLRTKDCFVEEVPSKEEVENEQENKAT